MRNMVPLVESVVGSCHSHSKDISHPQIVYNLLHLQQHLKDVLDVCVDAPISEPVACPLVYHRKWASIFRALLVVVVVASCVCCVCRGWWALASWRKLYPGSQKGESKGLVRHMKTLL
eukprot:scaffold9736_cov144-Skeletonema_marinoi.AAC.23